MLPLDPLIMAMSWLLREVYKAGVAEGKSESRKKEDHACELCGHPPSRKYTSHRQTVPAATLASVWICDSCSDLCRAGKGAP